MENYIFTIEELDKLVNQLETDKILKENIVIKLGIIESNEHTILALDDDNILRITNIEMSIGDLVFYISEHLISFLIQKMLQITKHRIYYEISYTVRGIIKSIINQRLGDFIIYIDKEEI